MSSSSVYLRKANITDLDAIKRIADANQHALGFVRRATLKRSIEKGWLIVAEDECIVGFVNYRHRRDTQTTLYEICVDKSRRRVGIGRALIRALVEEALGLGKTRICLKSPFDLPANQFYEAMGFTLIGIQPGKCRLLRVWEMPISTR